MASHFVWGNRSKESLRFDVKHAEAQKVLAQLIANADVLVQNVAPGAAARLGLSFETLHEKHPKLIVCDISGFGDDPENPGPYRDKKAYDLLIQSESGFLSVTGSPDEPAEAVVCQSTPWDSGPRARPIWNPNLVGEAALRLQKECRIAMNQRRQLQSV